MSILNPFTPSIGVSEGATVVDTVPIGAIMIWSGPADTVPEGWHICDGTNGTQDLRSLFVLGATRETEEDDISIHPFEETGGEEEIVLDYKQLPRHIHYVAAGVENSQGDFSGYSPIAKNLTKVAASTFSTLSPVFNPNNDGTTALSPPLPIDNMPPYVALFYIQKIANTTPVVPGLGSSGSAANDYSLEEQVIGTWIDGKPLYRKCLVLQKDIVSGLTNTNKKNISIFVENLSRIIRIGGNVYRDGYPTIEFNVSIPDTYCFYADFSEYSLNTLYITLKGSETKSFNSVIGGLLIVEYTKTTDD